MVTPESHVLSGCLRYLKARGIFCWRNNSGAVQIAPGRFMRFGKRGYSDILGVLPDGRTPEQADLEAREFVKYAVRAEP